MLLILHYKIQLVPIIFPIYFLIQLAGTLEKAKNILHFFFLWFLWGGFYIQLVEDFAANYIVTIYQLCDLGQGNYSECEFLY